MTQATIPPLTVYKASAGSGKTFTLASEYIRLLVENPQQYRSILAVTFTNKATEEMKMRILSQLYGIWKQLDDSQDYTTKICEKTGYDEKRVSQQAGVALHNLLHHYSYFRVSTIDTFFQSVLRNLARELNLTANLRIELNDNQVEQQAVDELIQDLQTTDLMLQWVLRYIIDNIEDDRSWNVINSIKRFGTTIFKDYYKEIDRQMAEKIGEPEFFEHLTAELKEKEKQALNRMKEISISFYDAIEAEGLTAEDLKNGNTIVTFFRRIQNGQFDPSIVNKTICSCSEDAKNWCRKGDEQQLAPIVEESLRPILCYALEERVQQWNVYQSSLLTLKHLSQLRLLDAIEHKVRQLNTDANRFLLSDTQQMLHKLIASDDSPFIFEKIGTQLEHIMIDEFQDTSTVQWQNFKVLLEECMSHAGSKNLIVGDVKQSIYRWRSGDWKLLNNIDTHFPQPNKQLHIEPLDVNYRSQRHIIEFNNAFFINAAEKECKQLTEKVGENLARQISQAYADVEQKIPKKRQPEGMVSITLYPTADYQDNMLSKLGAITQELLSHGARMNDMAILIRSKNVIPYIIDYFSANMPDVRIVSDEAFELKSSLVVRMLIEAQRLLLHPDDNIIKAALAKNYQRAILSKQHSDSLMIRSDINIDDFLPKGFLEQRDELLRMPLYELTERIYQIFNLQVLKDENTYLCTFYDYLNRFVTDNTSDLEAFLHYWEDTLANKAIQSDEVNGIRLLTIHKSKGLEFEHIIIPYCDWALEKYQDNILWCKAQDEPYSQLPLVPIDYSGKMEGTTYESAYYDEYLQNHIDNLNLLYVAFTRARCNLFVIGKHNASINSRSRLIEDVLPDVQKELEGATLTGINDKAGTVVFEYGSLYTKTKDEKISQNVFLQNSESYDVDICSYNSKTSFRQSNNSRDFINNNDEQDDSSNYIKAGNVLHNVFAHIRTADDIDGALRQLQMDGILYDAQLTPERITAMLRKRLEDPRVSDWFSGRWQLYNECTILTTDPETHTVLERRPDRVMTDGNEMIVVDFKFGKAHPEYKQQVEEYKQLLSNMGYQNVSGYLWYVYSNKIEMV